MHILLLPSWYPSHPADVRGVFFRDQAHALADNGHKVGVVSVNMRSVRTLGKAIARVARPAYEVDEGIPTYSDLVWAVPRQVPYGNYWLWRRAANRLLERYLAERGTPDIIHAHSAIYAGAVAAEWRERLGIPMVLTEHSTGFARGSYRGWQLHLARRAAQGTDAKVAVSPALGELLSRELGGQAGAWNWIPNVVASRFSAAATMATKAGEATRGANQPPRLLNLALMTEKKGQGDLLQAFASAFPDPSPVELWLGGDGPIRQRLEAHAHSLSVAGRIHFLGKVPPKEVPSLLAEVDVMVVASHYETFGVVAAEALMAGVPVVATRCGGPEYIVLEGDGALVPPRSPNTLAGALKDTVARLSEFDRAAIRERAVARFSGNAVANQLGTLYERVLAGEDS